MELYTGTSTTHKEQLSGPTTTHTTRLGEGTSSVLSFSGIHELFGQAPSRLAHSLLLCFCFLPNLGLPERHASALIEAGGCYVSY